MVCAISAAVVHDLTDVVPREVQVAVPDGTHPRRIAHPPTRVLRFDAATHGLGRTTIEAAPGERVPVYDPARTVVDLIRLRHRLGHEVAWSALHRYPQRSDASLRQVHAYARALGAETLVTTALDVATAR